MKLEIRYNEFNDNNEVLVDGQLYTQFTTSFKVNFDFDGKSVRMIETRSVPYVKPKPEDVGL